ncbi:LNS2 (Lipin/Ned1/Smp2) [Piscirickettsiaceae bacterium NZ-RLO1]|nr:LNS2 (Lipin/Ned1/Smp2) [Piscirickettsiaceae bacterium NZ-RLO1]
MKPIIIFDIDGTLSNTNHRKHLVKKNNWGDFFSKMGDDTLIQPIASLYRTLYKTKEYDLIIISGRPERYKKLTEQWLIWNEIPITHLYMRKTNDHRPDETIKEEILDNLLDQGRKIDLVIDDRKRVVDMWRRRGIICLQCAEGNF